MAAIYDVLFGSCNLVCSVVGVEYSVQVLGHRGMIEVLSVFCVHVTRRPSATFFSWLLACRGRVLDLGLGATPRCPRRRIGVLVMGELVRVFQMSRKKTKDNSS